MEVSDLFNAFLLLREWLVAFAWLEWMVESVDERERDGVVFDITDCCIGSLFSGNINDPTADPGGLIQQSVDNGLPVVYVAMNYRLNSK